MGFVLFLIFFFVPLIPLASMSVSWIIVVMSKESVNTRVWGGCVCFGYKFKRQASTTKSWSGSVFDYSCGPYLDVSCNGMWASLESRIELNTPRWFSNSIPALPQTHKSVTKIPVLMGFKTTIQWAFALFLTKCINVISDYLVPASFL